MISYSNKVKLSNCFKKDIKKVLKQGRNIDDLLFVVSKLANKSQLDDKYKNHKLEDNKYFKDCYECHIKPDWLLIYKYCDEDLLLLLIRTGSHSELF